MCVTYSFLPPNLPASFGPFQFLFFWLRTVNHCEDHAVLLQIQENILIAIFIAAFAKSLTNSDVFSPTENDAQENFGTLPIQINYLRTDT